MNINLLKKNLAVLIILLFVGVAVAPSINLRVVKASHDDALVEVTTQACGIKGVGDTTVKLTRQQYQNLEQYLVEFKTKLNQTTTRGEAVSLFKEAVVELDTYGLLPNGMSINQANHLILSGHDNPLCSTILDALPYSSRENADAFGNRFCLTAGQLTETITRGPILTVMSLSTDYIYRSLNHWFQEHYHVFFLFSLLFFVFFPIYIFLEIGNSLSTLCPFMFLSSVGIGYFSPAHPNGPQFPYAVPATGWVYTNGVYGVKNWSGDMYGNVLSYNEKLSLGMYHEYYPGILGFSGIKISLPFVSSFYLGYAIQVNVTKEFV